MKKPKYRVPVKRIALLITLAVTAASVSSSTKINSPLIIESFNITANNSNTPNVATNIANESTVPTTSHRTSQEFHEEGIKTQANLNRLVWPVVSSNSEITCGFESSNIGVEISAEEGAYVVAVSGGVVTVAKEGTDGCNYIIIDHGGGFQTEYTCYGSLLTQSGLSVKVNDVIALLGDSGNASGAYLHFELVSDGKNIDPQDFFA